MIKFEKYNELKMIKIATYFCVAMILLFVVATFAQYYSLKSNLTNPLIPQDLVVMSTKPYLIKGALLISGLLGVLALSFYKKNILALALAMIIILYYIFSNHHIGSWNTQIQ